jgi:hypothetical protein
MIKALSLMAAAVVAMGLSVSLAQAESHQAAFHTHVTTHNIAPVMLPHMAVGDVIPEATELHPVPDAIIATAPEFVGHGFYVGNDHIHVIHPETRAVVALIDRH